jgi:HAD superfamily hydrolase (TIGR01450 family)
MYGAIVDLDGTVYRGGKLLPGAQSGIATLREAGLDVLFFSNNPVKDGVAYAGSLSERGIPASPDEACSSAVVTTDYLTSQHAADEILCLGSTGLREQLRSAGLELTDDPERCDVLVVSWTPEFAYEDMQDALDAVDEETVFLGTDPDRTFPMDDGKLVPGSGAVIGAVAAVVGRDPDAVLGKPSEIALEFALERLDVPARQCLVVGDRLDTDIAMGERAGMTTALVSTGVTDYPDLAASQYRPDYVLDGLGDIETVLADLRENRERRE